MKNTKLQFRTLLLLVSVGFASVSCNSSLSPQTALPTPSSPSPIVLLPTVTSSTTEPPQETSTPTTSWAQFPDFYQSLPADIYLFLSTHDLDIQTNQIYPYLIACGLQQKRIYVYQYGIPVLAPDGKSFMFLKDQTLSIISLETSPSYRNISLPESLDFWDENGKLVPGRTQDQSKLAFPGNLSINILSTIDGTIKNYPFGDTALFGGLVFSSIPPRWSPDGKWIALYVASARSGPSQTQLYVLDMDCLTSNSQCPSPLHKIVIPNPMTGPLAWTPENDLAVVDNAYDVGTDQRGTIDLFHIPDGRLITVYHFPSSGGQINSIAWSPTNDWVAVLQENVQGVQLLSPDSPDKIISLTDCSGDDILGGIKK